MSYKETPEEIANEEQDDESEESGILLNSDEELEFEDEGNEAIALEGLDDVADLASKSKAKTVFSLKSRRAIEDHLEKRRLRKELDYMFDDNFAAEKNDKTTKE